MLCLSPSPNLVPGATLALPLPSARQALSSELVAAEHAVTSLAATDQAVAVKSEGVCPARGRGYFPYPPTPHSTPRLACTLIPAH